MLMTRYEETDLLLTQKEFSLLITLIKNGNSHVNKKAFYRAV